MTVIIILLVLIMIITIISLVIGCYALHEMKRIREHKNVSDILSDMTAI